MATPQEKLAQSLEVLQNLQNKQGHDTVIQSTDLTRVHRERLTQLGFIREVVKGWYMITPPDEQPGDSTSWYTNYWKFCARYLDERFGDAYCLSAEQSLELHAGNWSVPQQLIVRTSKNITSNTELLYGTSIFVMHSPLPEKAEIKIQRDIRILSLPSSLINCVPTVFTKSPITARTALSLIKDASEILNILLSGGHSKIAGRLAGAFHNIGQDRITNDIVKTMQSAGYDIRQIDPFDQESPVKLSAREQSPYINRIRLMWYSMRDVIIDDFPKPPGIPNDPGKYLKNVEDIFITDAYHSLSIERYLVTPELIERVRRGDWDPKVNEGDKRQKEAMAARGYWQAYQSVLKSVERVLNKENAGIVVEEDHSDWYRELFAPSVISGLLHPSDLAGYRNNQVYIGKSKHVPLNKDALRDAMPELFQLLQKEPEASVRAVLGHFVFVFIHPYMDGNGRMARFLMNVMLASGGYPWTVIPVEERDTYMNSLEKASADQDISEFAKFIAWLVRESLAGRSIAQV
ncbi:Fic family protein [Membranihabitans maritimus]|uniref:Fic family protein n=1 Tax=Membranihabitans maritimus TaxID=2904244 RepID=UPI001F2AD70C|nr:Fic family protein [Membranihabitans maritimus]